MAAYGIREQYSSGGIGWTSNDELIQRDQDEALAESQKAQDKPEIVGLSGHIRSGFTLAITAKQNQIQEEMLKSLRQRNGVYEADELQAIAQQGGTKIYMMITDTKCRALESFLKDIMLPVGDKPFEGESTPIPDVPPEIRQKAKDALIQEKGAEIAQGIMEETGMDPEQLKMVLSPEQQMELEDIFNSRMTMEMREAGPQIEAELLKQMKEFADTEAQKTATRIDDDFKEGRWYDAMSEFIEDLSTYPTAFIVGPLYRKRKVQQWSPIPGTQLSQLQFVDKIVKEYERFDPFDVYPGAAAKNIQDGDLYLRMRYQRKDLISMKGVPGYDTSTIDQVLSLYGSTGFHDFIYSDTEHANLHDRPQEFADNSNLIDGVKFFGSVQGLLLRQWGMTPEQIPNPFLDYNVEAISIGQYVIMARLNKHPLGKRGIFSASYKHKNGTVWGQAPPYLMRDIQKLCNALARAVCNNLAIASGPQVGINTDRLPTGADITDIYPWKIWTFTNPKVGSSGAGDQPLEFFQPKVITKELMAVYDYYFKQASEITGIPAYTSENLRGAGKTARGLAMLRNDAARGIRSVARNIDVGVIVPSVNEHWLALILEDPTIAKGDVKFLARASDYLVQQEQLEMQRNEVLDRSNNPVDLEIFGLGGRAEIWRENLRALKMDVSKIVPEKEDMIKNIVQQQVEQIVMILAQALGADPMELMAIIQGGVQPGAGAKNVTPGQGGKEPSEPQAAGRLPQV